MDCTRKVVKLRDSKYVPHQTMKGWLCDNATGQGGGVSWIIQKEKKETTTTVPKAILAHSKLGALATNAHVAYFTVDTIAELGLSSMLDSGIFMQLHE